MNDKNGGPAFPAKPAIYRQAAGEIARLDEGENGMTLRDYFAAAALTGIAATNPKMDGKDSFTLTDRADLAFKYADSMLAARDK